MPIVYTAIADDRYVVSEWPPAKPGDQVPPVIPQLLRTIDVEEVTRRAFDTPTFRFHYQSLPGRKVIFCVTDLMYPMRSVTAFLADIQKVIESSAKAAPQDEPYVAMNAADGNRLGWPKALRQRMEFHNDMKNDKVTAISEAVDQVKSVMAGNMDAVISRGEQLDHLEELSARAMSSAHDFERGTAAVRRAMCVRHWRIMSVIAVVVIVRAFVLVSEGSFLGYFPFPSPPPQAVIVILVIIICKPNFSRCS